MKWLFVTADLELRQYITHHSMSEHFIGICAESGQLTDVMQVCINELLYVRKIHDLKYFEEQCMDGINYHLAALKNVQDYLREIYNQVQEWSNSDKLDGFTVKFISLRDKQVKESWNFKLLPSAGDIASEIKTLKSKLIEEAAASSRAEGRLSYDIVFTLKDDVKLSGNWEK